MNRQTPIQSALRLHLTNVAGAGATQLLLSLLPALVRNAGVQFGALRLPDQAVFAS